MYVLFDTNTKRAVATADAPVRSDPNMIVIEGDIDTSKLADYRTDGKKIMLDELPDDRDVLAYRVRSYRNELLRKTDWIGQSDRFTMKQKTDWAKYRSALRDITKTSLASHRFADVVWPEAPDPSILI